MATLHILHTSPYSTSEIDNTLRLARPGDAVVLIQDAVFALKPNPRARTLDDLLAKGLKVFAIKADLDARSMKAPSTVELVGYAELVELIAQYEGTVS